MKHTLVTMGLVFGLVGCSSVGPGGAEEGNGQITENKQVPNGTQPAWRQRNTVAPLAQSPVRSVPKFVSTSTQRQTIARGNQPTAGQMVGFRTQRTSAKKPTQILTIGPDGKRRLTTAPQANVPPNYATKVPMKNNIVNVPARTVPMPRTMPKVTATPLPKSPVTPKPTNTRTVKHVVDTKTPAPTKANVPAMRMINSKRILLNYEVKDVGPSGVSGVDLWVTTDGRDWKKDESGRKGPPYVMDVASEGVYGFTLIARNGLGRGKQPPKPGDNPQVWVEVDLSTPVVNLHDVKQGLGQAARQITIEWSAKDKNLTRRPITLSYSTLAYGRWVPIAANLENTGTYKWTMPKSVPARFWLKVEAIDQVGNVGVAKTPGAIEIDLKEPTINIIGVEPVDQ